MLALFSGFASLIQTFAPLFDSRVWSYAQLLLAGAILAPGKRTITSVLGIVGLGHEKHFQNYHRVLNRARWSGRTASPLTAWRSDCKAITDDGVTAYWRACESIDAFVSVWQNAIVRNWMAF